MSALASVTPGQILLYSILGMNPGLTVVVNGVTFVTAELATDDDYWAAQSPLVNQARQAMYAGSPNANSVCSELAGLGYVVDTPIMNYGWDAMLTMWQRLGAGMSTVPDWTNTRSIKVSVMKADYPPFMKPAPVAAAGPVQLVGGLLLPETAAAGYNVYAFAPSPGMSSALIVNGEKATAPDGTPVQALVTPGLMGASVEWLATPKPAA